MANTPGSTENKHSTTTATVIQTEDISDDDILLVDVHRSRTKSIEALTFPSANDTSVPLATDLLSLPGHSHDELRDLRFLIYTDTETLSQHLQICLSLDRETTRPFDSTRTPTNCLHNIFRCHYIKTLGRSIQLEKKTIGLLRKESKPVPLSLINSSTSVSFQTDWNINRRQSSSTHRHKPKNIFHILQVHPTPHFFSTENPPVTSKSSTPRQANQNLERIKDILARAYYPHLYTAVESGYHFGFQSKFPNTHHLISTHDELVTVKEMPESPFNFDQSTTITLKSPPSSTQRRSELPPSPAMRKHCTILPTKQEELPVAVLPFTPIPHRFSEEADDSSPIIIKPSIVVLSQTSMPIPSPPMFDSDLDHNQLSSRKRKPSTTANVSARERKKKRFVSSPSPTTISTYMDNISDPEESASPAQLPKQHLIKNGLRSNFSKAKANTNGKQIR